MIPRCRCGRKAIAVAPGSEAIYAPGGILVTRAKPAKAWCKVHAVRQGWLQEAQACRQVYQRKKGNPV